MLEIRLLGQFDVRSNGGTPLVIPSRLHQSLLAYLLVTRTTAHRRETVAGLFWPEASEADARRNLRQGLWRLRKALDACSPPASDLVVSDDLTVGIDPHTAYSLDLARLEAAPSCPSTDELMCALDGYRGELLPDFYDEWVSVERARLQVLFEQQVERLLEQLCTEMRWKETLRWAERWIGLGQSPEPAYRALMVAHSALGNRSQVAAVFERCVATLTADVGVEPSEQTRALYERLAHGQAAPGTPLMSLPPAPPIFVVAAPAAPVTDAAPYKGLRYFDEDDADLFFGRERLVATLIGHLHEHHWLTVVGASGSGKSSLVRAGLIPALKDRSRLNRTPWPEGSEEWVIEVLTPTAHPLEALAIQLTRGAESAMATTTLIDDLARDSRTLRIHSGKSVGETGRLLIVIDQFEELFTLCRDERERQSFIANLLLATAPELDQPVYVVVALRADFYAQCGAYANLREALSRRQEFIGPMTAEEMRRAVEGPAQHGRWELEPGLVDLVLRDVGSEPGALPLLSHALLETWKRQRGRRLTLEGYAECGGVRGAIAQTAESVHQNLSPEQQTLARNIFLRLTELGEGTEDTRRRATIGELISHAADAPAIEKVLGILADARLVTIGENTAEVAHEALIREWSRLRDWLNENREGLRLYRHLTESAQAWEKLNREPGELYRGMRLSQALEWAKTNAGELNPLEREFLDASEQWQARQAAERETQQRRELEAARRLAEDQARTSHRLHQRALYLAGALLVAAVLAIAAIVLAQQSNQNEQHAENEQRAAFVRELSVNAVNNLDIDPERSILLALQAVSISSAGGQTVLREAEEALHRAVMTSRVQLTLRGHTATLNKTAYSPDGKHLATASNDGTAKVWDATTGHLLLTLAGHAGPVSDVVFSPDGKRLATSSDDGTAKVWDAVTGQELLVLRGHADQVRRVAFSPDGKRLVTAGGRIMYAPSVDHTAKVWDATTGQLLLTYSGQTGNIRGLAFSPDGARIATSSDDSRVQVWDATTGQTLLTFADHGVTTFNVVFSADGSRLATASLDRTAKVWNAHSGQLELTLIGHTEGVWGVAFNQAGTRVYTASLDGTAKMWDAATGQVLLTLAGHTGGLRDLALSPDETRVATASEDNTARVWDVTPVGAQEWPTLAGHTSETLTAVFSPDGKHIATGSADKTAKVWDAATGQELLTLKSDSDQLRSLAYSPDGKRLVTPSLDQTAKVWDATTGQVLLTLPTKAPPFVFGLGVAYSPDGTRIATVSANNTAKVWDATTGDELITLTGHTDVVVRVAYSPDGKRIATGDMDGSAKIWDARTGKELLTLKGSPIGAVYAVTFSPDGTRLATGRNDGTAKVWDAATGIELFTLSGHNGQINAVAFSPDSAQLATGSSDGTVKVWDIAGRGAPSRQPLTLYNLGGGVWTIAYSPDGRRLVTGGTLDGLARVWALSLDDIVAIAKSHVTRTLTTDECQKFLHVEACPLQ